MSHYYSSCVGGRGKATRAGHKTTGIQGHICGWETGIRVEGHYDEELGDIFLVYQTGGSNRKHRDVLLGKLVNDSFNSQENT